MDVGERRIVHEPEEVRHDSLVETVKSWVSHAGAVALEGAGDHLVLLLVVEVEAENVAGKGVVHSVEASVARVHVTFDQVGEDAQTLRSVDVDLLAGRVVHVAEVDGVHDAHLQGLDLL